MRRVHRPAEPPPFLRSPRAVEQQRRLFAYLRRDVNERRRRRDDLNEELFYDRELLTALNDVFSSKCAFCENAISSLGRVLHFRPLRYVEGDPAADNDYYLWLAFEWRNLFLSCDECFSAKGSIFPVRGTRAAYLATFDDVVEQEKPLLLDPTIDDPNKHLKFLHDGYCYALTEEGAATIRTFALNRTVLVSARASSIGAHLNMYRVRHEPRTSVPYPTLTRNEPHWAAIFSVLKQVALAWRPANNPVKGSGDLFSRNFVRAVRESSNEERERLDDAINAVISSEDQIRSIPRVFAQAQSFDTRSLRAKASYQAATSNIGAITIKDFKAIDALQLDFPTGRSTKSGAPCLMILGENSTGKSSILSAAALALIGRKEASKFKKVMPKLVRSLDATRLDQLNAQSVEVGVDFHFSAHRAHFIFDPFRRTIEGNTEPSTIVLGYGPRRFFNPTQRNYSGGAASRVRTLFDPMATIPYPGDWLQHQTGYRSEEIDSALRIVLALDDDDQLLVNADGIAVRANGRITPIDALSEGYRSVFVMTVDIIRELLEYWDNLEKAQAVVLIDELETHLHPRWKMQVMTALRRVFPGVQFIVTTHDPLCLRGMDDGEVEVFQRNEADQIRRLMNLPSVKGMTAEQLLTSDYFGLASTADPSAEIALARLTGDATRRTLSGQLEVLPSFATTQLLDRLTIGDSPSEQIVQAALQKYLSAREDRKGEFGPNLRSEAVEAVLKALTTDRN